MHKKNRDEMTDQELQEALTTDAENILALLSTLVLEGIRDAPMELLRVSDALMIVTGATMALESKYTEYLRDKHSSSGVGIPVTKKPDKKDFN